MQPNCLLCAASALILSAEGLYPDDGSAPSAPVLTIIDSVIAAADQCLQLALAGDQPPTPPPVPTPPGPTPTPPGPTPPTPMARRRR